MVFVASGFVQHWSVLRCGGCGASAAVGMCFSGIILCSRSRTGCLR